MGKYEDKPGDVVLFMNEKGTNDKAPDHKGFVVAHRDIKAGEKVEIALWGREGSACTLKGKVSDMRERKASLPSNAVKEEPFSDEIPF